MRIGLWGGSFNPPTIAHKALADFAFQALSLDRLLWIVSPQNPLKDATTLAPFPDRLAMVGQVLADRPAMTPSDIEQQLGSSYTISTVRHMRKQHPDDFLFTLMGTDNWQKFHLWGDDRAGIFDNVSIVIFKRPGYEGIMDFISSHEFKDRYVSSPDLLKPFGSWTVVENPQMDIAATKVRESMGNGVKHPHIAEETWGYIREKGLYRPK